MKLINGDALEELKKIPSGSVDLVYIDPPYEIKGIHYSGLIKNYRYKTHYIHQIESIVNGYDKNILTELVRVLKSIYIYIWCSKEQIISYLDYFVKELKCNYDILIWIKTNPTPFCSTHYLSDKEYCLVFWETGKSFNGSFHTANTYFISKKNTSDKNLYKHPTIKPLEFVKSHIINSTNVGDTVLDCFMGSGTTGVACQELKRDFIGIEINEEYYKIAVDRINGTTQKENKEQLKLF